MEQEYRSEDQLVAREGALCFVSWTVLSKASYIWLIGSKLIAYKKAIHSSDV
jgi:hypothetical protein